jgi:hypothetical protein
MQLITGTPATGFAARAPKGEQHRAQQRELARARRLHTIISVPHLWLIYLQMGTPEWSSWSGDVGWARLGQPLGIAGNCGVGGRLVKKAAAE